jgi:hypothetical protein
MLQKAYVVATTNQNICARWIYIIADIFSISTIAATGYFGIISIAIGFGNANVNLIGLALIWSFQISFMLSFCLKLVADTESSMNSVVRLYDYIDNNPSEKSFEENQPSSKEWPTSG